MNERCTETPLVSWVAEQERQMLFLCHLHLTVMCLWPTDRQAGRCGGLSKAWHSSAGLLFVCWEAPRGRSHNNPGKPPQGF